jgi:DNA invertase Pin-like site-specific DNA recombinase
VREGDVVVVNWLARLGRNTVHTIQLVEELNHHGVHFWALDFDSRTPTGKMIIGVYVLDKALPQSDTARGHA